MKVIFTQKFFINLITLLSTGLIFLTAGFYLHAWWISEDSMDLINPFVDSQKTVSYPLLQYTIKNLQNYDFKISEIVLETMISEEPTYTSFVFSYNTTNKKMTGQINIPDSVTANPEQENKVIILLRGYVPKEMYSTGVGTKNAAAAFASQGYITIAPDFFGYGGSSPESDNTWVDRFEKPITVVELIKSIRASGIPLELTNSKPTTSQLSHTKNLNSIGIWAHSNGGQIALTTLEIMKEPMPTTLWAPVTAPFPYSISYFSDELEDEGKSQRKWIAMFEEDYDVFEFTHTQHLDDLTGTIQIQHGDSDDAALIYWSQEFVTKVEAENERRAQILKDLETLESTQSANPVQQTQKKLELENQFLDPIDITLITYPDTNHNMIPSWNKAIQKDIQFFEKLL